MGQIPTVLRSELYAIPALVAAVLTVVAIRLGVYGLAAALGAAAVSFVIRMLGVRFGLNAPGPPGTKHGPDSGSRDRDPPGEDPADDR